MNMAALMSLFDPGVAYSVVFSFATKVLTYLTPVLFLIAVFIRIMETQLEGLISGGKWGQALKDIFVLGTAIAVYFGVFALIAGFVNPIYAWIEHTGSISAITDSFNQIIDAVKAKRGEQSYLDYALGLTAVPFQIGSSTFHIVTLGIAAFVTLFLKIAHAFGFGVALVWGLIAIPMSVTSNLKLLRGWGLLVGFILAWPLVQALIISLFAPMFQIASNRLLQDVSTTADWNLVGIHIVFGIAHLLLAAILVAAPLIAAYLTANAPSGAAVVMPFATAAVGAAVALFKGKVGIPLNGPAKQTTLPPALQVGPRQIAGDVRTGVHKSQRDISGRTQSPSSGPTSTPVRGEPVANTPRAAEARNAPSVGGRDLSPPAHSPTAVTHADGGAAAAPSPVTNANGDAVVRKKKQARRGAVLNQKKKALVNPQ